MKIDKRYPIKALKFVFYFYFLFFLLIMLAYVASHGNLSGFPASIEHALTPKLAIALVVLGLAYPFFGFARRYFHLVSGFEESKHSVIDAFVLSGFELESQDDNRYVFRAKSRFKRMFSMYEDSIEVIVEGNTLQLTGLRRDLGKIILRLHDFTRSRS